MIIDHSPFGLQYFISLPTRPWFDFRQKCTNFLFAAVFRTGLGNTQTHICRKECSCPHIKRDGALNWSSTCI